MELLGQSSTIVTQPFLLQTKQGAFIINAGRGPLINTPDLEAALRAGRIQAALDVTEPEPLPPGHSLWTVRLFLCQDVFAAKALLSRMFFSGACQQLL